MAAPPSINGIPISMISNVKGLAIASIKQIGGIDTTKIDGWPTDTPPGPSCDTLLLGYTNGRKEPPTAACTNTPNPYELDPLTNILYTKGGCGIDSALAPGGFYSDGVMIYTIGPDGTFKEVTPCEG